MTEPKKHSSSYTDFKKLVVYCIKSEDCSSVEEVAQKIFKEKWMSPASKHTDLDSIRRHVKQAWDGSKKEVWQVGVKEKSPRLTEPQKISVALEYVKERVVFDTFNNSFIDTHTSKETSPNECFISYNDSQPPEMYVQKFFFEVAFESIHIPKINPLLDWSTSLPKWNKKDHIAQLCTFIPAKDKAQLELFLKSWLIRAYIQAVNPNNKSQIEIVNRHFLILQSDMESSGKSSFLSWLAPHMDWVKISGIEQGKDGKRALANYMIVVDDEMSGITQFKEHESFKGLISMSKVDVRLPYAKKDSNLPRVASFCGSCNNARLFPVGEQSTRFLCVPLEDRMFDFRAYMRMDKAQIWAQVKALSKTTWLHDNDAELRKMRAITNESFERESMELHAVTTHVRKLEPTDLNPKDARTNQWGQGIKVILRTGDIMNLLRCVDHYKGANLNLNVLGAALRKIYGPPIRGFTVRDLIVGGKVSNYKYTATEFRTHGYPMFFDEKGVNGPKNDRPAETTVRPKKAKKRPNGKAGGKSRKTATTRAQGKLKADGRRKRLKKGLKKGQSYSP